MKVKDWIDNDIGIDIWEKKYRNDGESFDSWLERISNGNKDIKKLIIEKKFLFGGRILSNRGLQKTGRKITYSNCYVCQKPEDNIESIFECASKIARTFSYGGGIGIDLSNLSPRGTKINNTAKETSGAVSFMELYSTVTGLIGQNGRRGALMISLNCNHPDLEEFIEIKSDLQKITKANISIRITDKFLEAVKNNSDYDLEFTRIETGEKISKTINARKIFNKFAKMNWDYAEPALLYWDRIEKWNLLSNTEGFEYSGVNPCFSGDMKLLTTNGYKTFEELEGKKVDILSYDGKISKGNKVWCSGVKDTVEVKLSNGKTIKCTPSHVFMLNDGTECEAKDLNGKRIKSYCCNDIKYNDKYIKYGFIQGDGQLNKLSYSNDAGVEINIGSKDNDIKDIFLNEDYKEISNRAIRLYGHNKDLIDLGFSTDILPNRTMPKSFGEWDYINKISFIRGMFSANGCVVNNHRIQYKSTCYELILELQEALYDLNINTNITTNDSKVVKFDNGEYLCRESYDLCINQFDSIIKFYETIGFVHSYKNESLKKLISQRDSYVVSVKECEKIKVYDFTENINHWGVVEGYIVHNCAEEPLPAGGSCLLGSINLSEFVNTDGIFDIDDFKRVVKTSVVALNEVLEEGMDLHPLKEQRHTVYNWKQIGLGIFGLADMFIKMKLVYGSDESLKFCDKISKIMINEAVLSSAMIAKDAGSYPMFDYDSVSSTDFYKENITKEVDDVVKKYGIRNSQILTIAPTGTLSTMIGVSGGIEPIFEISYNRKTESLHGKDVSYRVYTPIVKKYMEKNNLSDENELPEYFITSKKLNYIDRINMQSVWQNRIDASISSTVNVPNDFTIEEVEQLYLYAHEKGLKGVTIFRDGCKRLGILTTEPTTDVTKKEDTIKRGHVVDVNDDVIGLKRKIITGCGSLHCTAFFDKNNGNLLETYLSKGSTGGCNSFMIGLSRMISLASRGGVGIDDIVDQLNSTGSCPSYAVRSATKRDTSKGACCPMAIGNALKDMFVDVRCQLGITSMKQEEPIQKALVKNPCPVCGSELQFTGGCNFCVECSYSKCD